MKSGIKFFFIGKLIYLFCLPAAGQTLYVSPSGNDRNKGSYEQPLASLAGARDQLREMRHQGLVSDTVFVKIMSGVYQLSQAFALTEEDGGTAQAPVIYTAAENGNPVFYGGFETGKFEVVTPSLWKVYVPETESGFSFEQLYINGERRFRAQTPNKGQFFKVKKCEEIVLAPTEDWRTQLSLQKLSLHDNEAYILNNIVENGTDGVLARFYHLWINTNTPVRHVSLADTALYLTANVPSHNPFNEQKKAHFIIENYRKALDAPGEWFLDCEGWLWYIPLPGETPENVRCMLPVIKHFLVLKGRKNEPVKHIRFENLRFEISTYRTSENGNKYCQAASDEEATVMLDDAENITFRNCEIAHTGTHALWFRERCAYSRVEHCHFYDLGGGSVKIGAFNYPGDPVPPLEDISHHIVVHNNIFHHGGYVLPGAAGLSILHGSDNEISHNEIADFRYSGISAGWVWGYAKGHAKRNKIIFNHIHHLGWGEMSDMGGVYTLDESEGSIVANNVIHHAYSFNYGVWGLYADEGSIGYIFENNLVYAFMDEGFTQHLGKDNIVRNNIFANNHTAQIQFQKKETHLSYSFTNNIIYQDRGKLFYSWSKADELPELLQAQVLYDYNCYWDTRTKSPEFCTLTFAEWRKLGRDKHSIIADPLFVDPSNFDFRFRNTSVIKKIGFTPIDYTKAGVYGSSEWIEKAKLPDDLLKQYDELVKNDPGLVERMVW
ncbi:MAG: right-handed parallel beta-helix repeat-containing protein [Dysgonamonadaceae bacterium]|nr:right-handed parallel beta-helix repeat-containing protein [Dysgonamonadaceae bacterium]